MSGLGIRPAGRTTRFPAGECAAAVTSKPWGMMTAETRTQARSRLQRSLRGGRAISRPPSHPSRSSPPSSKSLPRSCRGHRSVTHTCSVPVCFCSSTGEYLNTRVQSCLFVAGLILREGGLGRVFPCPPGKGPSPLCFACAKRVTPPEAGER